MAGFKLSLMAVMLSWLILTVMATIDVRKIKPGEDIVARLEGDEGGSMTECWNALMELKACTNEIILFFINGESYMGMDCCRAIRVITHHCWPSMLTSLGYTAEEGDVLHDYCGKSSPQPSPAGLLGQSTGPI